MRDSGMAVSSYVFLKPYHTSIIQCQIKLFDLALDYIYIDLYYIYIDLLFQVNKYLQWIVFNTGSCYVVLDWYGTCFVKHTGNELSAILLSLSPKGGDHRCVPLRWTTVWTLNTKKGILCIALNSLFQDILQRLLVSKIIAY